MKDFDPELPCQCNADCTKYSSCCPDFQSVCNTGPPLAEQGARLGEEAPGDEEDREEGSCASYGCVKYDGTHSCQCNDDCAKYDSCCSDYADTCSVSGKKDSWEKVPEFPVDVVNEDYKAACEGGNSLDDGWMYLYNEGRGTDNAACGTSSNYWCCRQCVDDHGCKDKSTTATRSTTTNAADDAVPARQSHAQGGAAPVSDESAEGRGGRRQGGGAESRGGEEAADDGGGGDEDDDPEPYDCSVGTDEDWKTNKKLWCCVIRKVGCEETQATAEPTPSPSTTTSIATTTSEKAATSTSTGSTTTAEDPEADVALR